MLIDGRRLEFACEMECPFVGTTAAILIGSAISAAAGLGSAAIQSKQVSKAVGAQKEATNQAIENLKPFQQTGTEAFTTLGKLMGLGGGGGGQAPAAMGTGMDAPISPGQANFAGYTPQGGYLGKNVTMGERMSNPNANVDMAGYTAQQHGASLPTASSYGTSAQQTGAPMMRGQTPTGQMVQVPAEKAGEFQQNGGKILGQA